MSKKPPHPGNMYASERTKVASIKAAYPEQFPGAYWDYSWPMGWHSMVADACVAMARLNPTSHWGQIKEKFGGLRLHYTGRHLARTSPNQCAPQLVEFEQLIRSLEEVSLSTCCLCGGTNGPGELVDFNGWWLTTCATCEPLIRAHRALPFDQR